MPIITDPRSAEAKKQVRYRSSQLAVNNAIVNTKKNRYTTEIYKGLERYECSINNNTSLNQAAKILLGELGCSIGTESPSFSLEDDDTEIIDNENIVDPSIKKLKPEELSPTESFIEEDDPFYKLDDELPKNIVSSRESEADSYEASYVTIAAYLTGGGGKSLMGTIGY